MEYVFENNNLFNGPIKDSSGEPVKINHSITVLVHINKCVHYVKKWCGADLVICLVQCADLHGPADASANHCLLLQ